LLLGAGLGVGVGVLLEDPDGQVAAEFAGTLLALVEGDELVLRGGVEHQVEGGGGMGQPTSTQLGTAGVGTRSSLVHDGYSKRRPRGSQTPGYPIPRQRAQERDCTHATPVHCFFRFVQLR
jgi:hypothetical protein